MLHFAVSKKEDIVKHLDQLKTIFLNETIKILSDEDKIVAFVKPISRNRFTSCCVDFLYSIAFSLLEFHKCIYDSYRAKEYVCNYLRMIKKLNQNWQKKEIATPRMSSTFFELFSIGNTKANIK